MNALKSVASTQRVKHVCDRMIKCIWHCFLVDKGSDRYFLLGLYLATAYRSEPLSTKKQCHMHILQLNVTCTVDCLHIIYVT